MKRRVAVAGALAACAIGCELKANGVDVKKKTWPIDARDADAVFAEKPKTAGVGRLSDSLVLAIPPEHHPWWVLFDLKGNDRSVRMPIAAADAPKVPMLGFRMFMPDFGGYTRDNYLDDFHKDKIDVFQIQPAPMRYALPGEPGSHVPNMFERVVNSERSTDFLTPLTRAGLKCYIHKPETQQNSCWGVRDAARGEQISLHAMFEPNDSWVVNPIMQATYFTPRYGGLEIRWRASMKHFDRWLEIDQQIWRYIETWNLLEPKPGP